MEVSFAVGWRMKWRRFSVASTIAMLKSCFAEVSGGGAERYTEEDIPIPIS
jgi:hypothetical protein